MSELRGHCWCNPTGHWLLGLLRHHLHHLLTEGCGGDCEHTHTHTIDDYTQCQVKQQFQKLDHEQRQVLYSQIPSCSHWGLLFHHTPIKYTGIPVAMMPKPMAHSFGVFQKETMMRKRQASTKLTGSRIFTCREKIGGFITETLKDHQVRWRVLQRSISKGLFWATVECCTATWQTEDPVAL